MAENTPAASRSEDAALVVFVEAWYGEDAAEHVAALLDGDPTNQYGFTAALRRSLTYEMEAKP